MRFRKITPHEVPVIISAHSHARQDFTSRLPTMISGFEIFYVETGPTICFDGENEWIAEENSVSVRFGDKPLSVRCENGMHKHHTVIFKMESDCETLEGSKPFLIDSESLKKDRAVPFALLPFGCCIQDNGLISEYIKKIIRSRFKNEYGEGVICAALLLSLLAEITGKVVRQSWITNLKIPPSNIHYSNLAAAYISRHFTEPDLRIKDIAEAVDISSGYLCKIFHAVTGYTMIEYANLMKIKRAKDLLSQEKLGVQQVAETVGIMDASYFSRLFKKAVGVPPQNFKQDI